MNSGLSCLVILLGLNDLVLVQLLLWMMGGGGVGGLPMRGVFLVGAVKGSVARAGSLGVVVANMVPVV
jgi:hypothetical protein